MRAAVISAPHTPITIEDVSPLAMGPTDVRVRVEASGVCHSDLAAIHGKVVVGLPCVLGHEGVGIVEAVGDLVSRLSVGDRVIGTVAPVCGNCYYCIRDRTNLCETSRSIVTKPRSTLADGTSVIAYTGLGTFAEEMIVDETVLVKVTSDLPTDQLALLGCGVTTGMSAVFNTARVSPGSTVAVIGCGGVGQAVIQGAAIAGAARIFAVDPVAMKRETAKEFGATDLIDPEQGDPTEQIFAANGGRGVDYAFEVVGRPETMLQAYNTAQRGGTVLFVGMPAMDSSITFPAFKLFYEEKRTLGSYYGSAQVRRDIPRLIGLAESGRLDLGAMVSRTYKLDEINDAVRAIEAGEVIRSVIV